MKTRRLVLVLLLILTIVSPASSAEEARNGVSLVVENADRYMPESEAAARSIVRFRLRPVFQTGGAAGFRMRAEKDSDDGIQYSFDEDSVSVVVKSNGSARTIFEESNRYLKDSGREYRIEVSMAEVPGGVHATLRIDSVVVMDGIVTMEGIPEGEGIAFFADRAKLSVAEMQYLPFTTTVPVDTGSAWTGDLVRSEGGMAVLDSTEGLSAATFDDDGAMLHNRLLSFPCRITGEKVDAVIALRSGLPGEEQQAAAGRGYLLRIESGRIAVMRVVETERNTVATAELSGMIKSGQEFQLEYGVLNVPSGVALIVRIDGKELVREYFDMDRNPIYRPGGFGLSASGGTSIAIGEITVTRPEALDPYGEMKPGINRVLPSAIDSWLVLGPFNEAAGDRLPRIRWTSYDDTDEEFISYQGEGWQLEKDRKPDATGALDSEGTAHVTTTAGDVVEIRFRGVGIQIIGQVGKGSGMFEATIDGKGFGQIDGKDYGDSIRYGQTWMKTDRLVFGDHVIRIRNRKQGGIMAIDKVMVAVYTDPLNIPEPDYATPFIDGEGAERVMPTLGEETAAKVWQYFDDRLYTRNLDDYQDLYLHYTVKQNIPNICRVAYAHVYVHVPASTDAMLEVGANAGISAWMNGSRIGDSGPAEYAARDAHRFPISLQKGWNTLLLRITNDFDVWGFYARLIGADGKALEGVTYSLEGDQVTELSIDTGRGNLTENAMPKGYEDWPYVWMALLDAPIESGGRRGDASASPFRLTASGGTAPYEWTIASGHLPRGLRLESDTGTIQGHTTLAGEFDFTIQVSDSAGKTVQRDLRIMVKPNPATVFLRAHPITGLWGIVGQIHSNPEFSLPSFVDRLKNIGYGLLTTHSSDTVDSIVRAADMDVGTYISLKDNWIDESTPGRATLSVIEKVLSGTGPEFILFDETGFLRDWQDKDFEMDALFSAIKAIQPDTVIVNNMGAMVYDSGDIDLLFTEATIASGGWYWGKWPEPLNAFADPKNPPFVGYRLAAEKGLLGERQDNLDPQEFLRSIFSLIGQGAIADMSFHLSTGEVYEKKQAMFQEMEEWMHPTDAIDLRKAFTGVTASDDSETWGYAMSKEDGTGAVLYVLENSYLKRGVPEDGIVSVRLQSAAIGQVTMMNDGEPVPFKVADGRVRIDLSGITPDPVCTILDVDFAEPFVTSPTPIPTGGAVPDGVAAHPWLIYTLIVLGLLILLATAWLIRRSRKGNKFK